VKQSLSMSADIYSFSLKDLKAEKLHCGGSAIWNALAIDYPSDSFSHIVIKHEGLQGQLPNMDVINTFTRIAQKTGGIPVSLAGASEHDPTWGSEPLGKVGRMLEEHLWKEEDGTKKYLSGLLNVAKQIGYLSSGQPSGIHGLFHRYVSKQVETKY
jgi:glycosylphosphatidylinositol transamidase